MTETNTDPASVNPLADPRALTILTTEHWSLLSARSLVYNEAFARGAMFLTFLSASLVALGLVSAGTGFTRDFALLAVAVLGLDLFIGIATMARVAASNAESVRYLQGMSRLRHAYHEAVPGLEAYFIDGHHDDLAAIAGDLTPAALIPYHFTTMPGMLAVICGAVAATLCGLLAWLLTGSLAVAVAAGLVGFTLVIVGSIALIGRWIRRVTASFDAEFPSHAGSPDATE